MRRYLLAAAAALVIASPAAARDGSPYVGIEGGVTFPQTTKINVNVFDVGNYHDAFSIKSKMGYDVDALLGYDFGVFRVEGELGYKRAKLDRVTNVDTTLLTDLSDVTGLDLTAGDLDLGGGHVSVLSGMVNGLADFSIGNSLGVYAGGGVGRARVKMLDAHDNAWAWQLIAGIRAPISENIDVGLKYRYFQTGRLYFNETDDFDGTTLISRSNTKYRSHSLLASLTYNFGGVVAAPPPPPVEVAPPPPPAPATQTCPDGSVILATDACPPPPPPPPPPAPAPSGERGL